MTVLWLFSANWCLKKYPVPNWLWGDLIHSDVFSTFWDYSEFVGTHWHIGTSLGKPSKKNNHWICDHDHTSPDPPPSFLKTVTALGDYFFVQFSDHLNSQVHPKTIFHKLLGRFEQNNANDGHNSFQQIRDERRDIQVQICWSLYEIWTLEWVQSLFLGFLEPNS